MQVNKIDNQVFQSKKFQIPIKKLITKWGDIHVDMVKEYSNPNAEELYKQAQQTRDLRKKADLFYQMGDYRIIDKKTEKIRKNVFRHSLY